MNTITLPPKEDLQHVYKIQPDIQDLARQIIEYSKQLQENQEE